MTPLPLHAVAHARAGDKGNRLNVSVIAYHPLLWPAVLQQVTAGRVHALFSHRGATGVVRYELPNVHALNFVIDGVLEGGVNSALNLDGHGKTSSFRLLSLPIDIDDDLAARLPALRSEP